MPTLDKVTVDLMVVLGTTTMPIHQVLRLSRGAIIELDATEADEVKVLANNLPVASGVVLVDRNRIAVEVKQMLPRTPGTRWRPGHPIGPIRAGRDFPAKLVEFRAFAGLYPSDGFVRSAPLIRPALKPQAGIPKALVAELVDALP